MTTKTIELKNGTTKTFEVKERQPAINNSALLENSNLKIVHINAGEGFRSMTVAYERINKSHIKISTAVCHRADTFEKKIGTKTAIENFQKGNTIILPLDVNCRTNVAAQIRGMFFGIQS